MTKKSRVAYLVIGIVAGLLLTACAGVASGKIDLPGNPSVFTFGSSVQVVQIPEFQTDTINLIPLTHERANLMAAHKTALQETLLESATVHGAGGLCDRP
jgi:hypothetical protein